jgi:hypothetical protein
MISHDLGAAIDTRVKMDSKPVLRVSNADPIQFHFKISQKNTLGEHSKARRHSSNEQCPTLKRGTMPRRDNSVTQGNL